MTLIRIIDGDLLQAEENIIMHQVNAQGEMNTGVAQQVKEKWYDEVYKYYKSLCDGNMISELMGYAQKLSVGKDKYVVNLFGQDKYGYDGERYTNYEALYVALDSVARFARRHNLSVALPYKMGCDRAGADWNIVYAMIEKVFKNHTQPITIYRLNGQHEYSFMFDTPPTLQKELVLN
ncbi:Appr-1-p processing protein [Lysinibacillus xylanilyticus]|uniref:Appr-1-p processing protein n=1 Tax=Lysinibacillus xylanilyticus TaxID=582475 RepID=UPI003830F59D